MNFRKLLKNKIIQFVLSRYITYFIQFINSLLIALYLGPFYLGVWGLITLILQYINQFNLGIPHSINAILSVEYNNKSYVEKVVNSSISLVIILSVFIILFFIFQSNFILNNDDEYNIQKYLPFVVITGILGQFNVLFSNIFRVHGKLIEIAVSQTTFPILMCITIFLFKGEDLLYALVIVNLISFGLSLLFFIIRAPTNLHLLFDINLFRKIQIKGWHLFIYNTSFYLTILSTRSFISNGYSVLEFGYFTFAYTLANVILLLLQSLSSLIYPKLINRMAHSNNERVFELIMRLRTLYVTTSHFLAHISILIYPIFLSFFPEFRETKDTFLLIALTVVLYTNSFGYSGLLISRNKEKLLGRIALFSLMINIVLVYFLVHFYSVSYSKVIIATMISYLWFVVLLSFYGRKCLLLKTNFRSLFLDVFPMNIFIPYVVCLTLSFLEVSDIYYTIPLLIFILINFKNLPLLRSSIIEIIKKPNVINV